MIESTEAFRRFANGQAWNQLDFQTQQQIRLMAILEQATAKYGDTLANSVNGRISLFKSLLKDSALNVGNAMLPVINAMMPVLNSLAMVLKNVTAKLAEFVALMFNKKATSKAGSAAGGIQDVQKAAEGAGNALGDLGDAGQGLGDVTGGAADNLDDTAKSAKKAVKELMGLAGFDEITTLNLNKDDGDGGGGSGGSPGGGGGGKGGKEGSGSPADILPTVELTDMDNQFKSIFDGLGDKLKGLWDYMAKLGDLFKKGFDLSFRYESLDRLKTALKGIWQSLKDIFEDGQVLAAAARFGERLAFALGQTTGAIANIIMGLAVFIAESLNKSLNETKWDTKAWLIRQFDIAGDIVASIGNIAQVIGQVFYDTITSSGAIQIRAALISVATYAFIGLTDLIGKSIRELVAFAEEILVDNQERLTKALSGILSAAEPVFTSFKDLVRDSFEGFNKLYDDHIKPTLDSITDGMSEIVGVFLDSWNTHIQPVLDSFGQGLSALISDHVGPMVEQFLELWGKLTDASKLVWEEVLQPFFSFLAEWIGPILAPALQFLGDHFVNTWSTVADIVTGVLQIFTGLIDFVVGVFTGNWEQAWEGVKEIFNGFGTALGAIAQTLWDTLVAGAKALWDTVVALFAAAWDGIVRIFSPIGTWFGERWSETKAKLAEVGNWFTTKFQEGWSGLTSIFQKLGGWFSEQWGKVKSNLGEVGSWFSGKFNEAYEGVKRAFSGITSFFSGIWSQIKSTFTHVGTMVGEAIGGAVRGVINGVLATVENTINSGINLLNGAIGVINKLPGVSIGGFSHISLPRLARGGIVDSPTIAMIGEAGKEVVMPLENTGFLQTMGRVVGGAVVNALGGYAGQSSNGFNGEIVINIGGREFGRFAIDAINEEQARAGQLLLNI